MAECALRAALREGRSGEPMGKTGLEDLGIAPLDEIEPARRLRPAGARARALRRAGERLGERLRRGPVARRLEVLPLDRIPCRASVAFDGALRARWGWLALERRALYAEIEIGGAVRRLVLDPVEPHAWTRTPWGERVVERRPAEARRPGARSVVGALASIGVRPEQIDVAIVTHLRGQDLRPMVGTERGDGLEGPRPSVFPRARWIVDAGEWADALDPDEHERPYLVRDGLERVARGRVVLVEQDLALGPSAALVSTPGLTAGHRSFFVRAQAGVLVWSSHGVSAQAWSPYHASLPGLRERVREMGFECIPRADCASRRDALGSMSFERAAADADPSNAALPLLVPSQGASERALRGFGWLTFC